MIRSILKLAVFLVVGVLVYNFFLGTPEEKEQSRAIFNKGKEVVVSVGDLVKSEKEKFDSGKYDEALDKVGNLFNGMREKADDLSSNDQYKNELEELDAKRRELQEDLKDVETDQDNNFTSEKDEKKARKIQIDLDKLMDKAKDLMDQMEENAQ